LLVLCMAFCGKPNFPNLTIKKIPKHVLYRCEWDHDDYSLQVENLPKAPPEPIEEEPEPPHPSATPSDQLQLEL
jgi:adenine-specific DNA-methyltransferase